MLWLFHILEIVCRCKHALMDALVPNACRVRLSQTPRHHLHPSLTIEVNADQRYSSALRLVVHESEPVRTVSLYLHLVASPGAGGQCAVVGKDAIDLGMTSQSAEPPLRRQNEAQTCAQCLFQHI